VLEARDRVGGRVWSVPFAGAVIERGAEFVLPDYAVMLEAVARLGLSLVRKGTTYGYREPRGGEAVSMTELSSAMRQIAGIRDGAGGETVRTALSTMGLRTAVAEAICARLEVSCTYPAEDLELSALREGAGSFGEFDTHTIAGGNDRLARALAGALPDGALRLSTPVTRIAWSPREVQVRARRRAGDDVELTADAAIVTVPASVTRRIEFDPPLPHAKLDALGRVRYGQAAKLFVGLRTPAPPSATLSVPDRYWCYTQLGADGEPLPFVGAFAGTVAALDALEIARGPERWVNEVQTLRPDLDLDPDTVLLSRWDDDPWVRGSYSARAASSPMDPDALRAPVGALQFAGEHTAGEWHGLMEGALHSGIRAARELLEE
jgi:monoamine oxidase